MKKITIVLIIAIIGLQATAQPQIKSAQIEIKKTQRQEKAKDSIFYEYIGTFYGFQIEDFSEIDTTAAIIRQNGDNKKLIDLTPYKKYGSTINKTNDTIKIYEDIFKFEVKNDFKIDIYQRAYINTYYQEQANKTDDEILIELIKSSAPGKWEKYDSLMIVKQTEISQDSLEFINLE